MSMNKYCINNSVSLPLPQLPACWRHQKYWSSYHGEAGNHHLWKGCSHLLTHQKKS